MAWYVVQFIHFYRRTEEVHSRYMWVKAVSDPTFELRQLPVWSRGGLEFYFYIRLICILCHAVSTWYLRMASAFYVMGHHIVHMLLCQETRCWLHLLDCCYQLHYLLDAELFLQCQLIPHREHIVPIMTTLSSAFVCVSQRTQSASTIITRKCGMTHLLTQEWCV